MFVIFSVFYILIAAAMIVLILLQNGAGADAGSGFGGGASATVFGARGSSTFLTRATGVLAGLFFLLSLAMGIYLNGGGAPVNTASDLGLMSTLGETPGAKNADAAKAAAPAGGSEVPVAPTAPATQPASGTGSEVPTAPAPENKN